MPNLMNWHAVVLKFLKWIPHGKIADPYFFLVQVISLSGVTPMVAKMPANMHIFHATGFYRHLWQIWWQIWHIW